MPQVSIIIVNWNGKRYLKECLDSVFAQSYKDLEVILVDNASRDGSVEFVKKNYPKVRVFVNTSNRGFADANNIGLRAAKGEYVVTLNNDTKADKRFLAELVKCAGGSGDRVGSVASKMLYYSNPGVINAAGMFALKDGAARDLGVGEPDSQKWNKRKEVFGACAGAALYSRKALNDVAVNGEYFDSSFFAYFEDADLAYRLRLRGWKTIYCPKAVVLHHGGGTSKKIHDFNIYYGSTNRLKIIVKDIPFSTLLRALPWILFRQMLEFIYYTVLCRSTAPTTARLQVLSEIGSLFDKRRAIQSRKRIKDGELEKWMQGTPVKTIFYERFINRRKG